MVKEYNHLLAYTASATNLDVNNSDAACNQSMGTPFCTTTVALAAAVRNDLISFSKGTHSESINFTGKAGTLRSSPGPAVTRIEGNLVATIEMHGRVRLVPKSILHVQ